MTPAWLIMLFSGLLDWEKHLYLQMPERREGYLSNLIGAFSESIWSETHCANGAGHLTGDGGSVVWSVGPQVLCGLGGRLRKTLRASAVTHTDAQTGRKRRDAVKHKRSD